MHACLQCWVGLNTCVRAFFLLQLSWLDILASHVPNVPSSHITRQSHVVIGCPACSSLYDKAAAIST